MTISTLTARPYCRHRPAAGRVYPAQRQRDFPGKLNAEAFHQALNMTVLIADLPSRRKCLIVVTDVSRPRQRVPIAIVGLYIEDRSLTPAVSSLTAYSTPAW